MCPLVTLTTDLGEEYGAQLKAVLYRSLPAGSVVDLTHSLPAHRVPEAAFLLLHMARRFPAGTIHVAVVDPGVGTDRAPAGLATADGSTLVGPDNGLLWPLASALGNPRAFRLDPARVAQGAPVSSTFEGRDLFAPAAALVASGGSLESLGTPFEPHRYEIPTATVRAGSAEGIVLHLDRFGNVITNVPTSDGPAVGVPLTVCLGPGPRRKAIRRTTYAELGPRGGGVLGSSFGTLELSCRERSAAKLFGARVGDRVRLSWRK
ncbi:MAG TPA: SAM-dependent chlorinase/fluorinase [Thermoplasmata archaeon]|nr:SAM-dependent chlorinase/fluorinase [Thermoplasmata archaeon]